jgi:hypothetical protein
MEKTILNITKKVGWGGEKNTGQPLQRDRIPGWMWHGKSETLSACSNP